MGIIVKINDATIISDSTIEDTDLADAMMGIAVRGWASRFFADHPEVTKIEVEKT